MGKAEGQSKFGASSELNILEETLTSIETEITNIEKKIDDIKTDGALNVHVFGVDINGVQRQVLLWPNGKVLARTEPLLQSEYDRVVTRDANGYITQIVVTDGVRTKTIVVTRDVDNRITTLDETVV